MSPGAQTASGEDDVAGDRSAATASAVVLLGSEVRFWTYGPESERPILMVHGFRGNHLGLQKIIAGLAGRRVIVPDLPGYGLSTPMSGVRHDVDGYSAFVEAFMAELQLDRPILLGHSFGSIIAAHIAATRSGLIGDLVLVNPIAARPDAGMNLPVARAVDVYYWLCAHLPECMALRLVGSKTFNRLMSLTLAKTHDRDLRHGIFEHHLRDLAFPQNLRVIEESFGDSVSRTVADEAEFITCRTLLVAGELDSISPAAYVRRLDETLKDSTLVLIPGVGHLVHLETPLEAARAIDEFLGRQV